MFLWQHGLRPRIILPTLLRETERGRKTKRMSENETTKRAPGPSGRLGEQEREEVGYHRYDESEPTET